MKVRAFTRQCERSARTETILTQQDCNPHEVKFQRSL